MRVSMILIGSEEQGSIFPTQPFSVRKNEKYVQKETSTIRNHNYFKVIIS